VRPLRPTDRVIAIEGPQTLRTLLKELRILLHRASIRKEVKQMRVPYDLKKVAEAGAPWRIRILPNGRWRSTGSQDQKTAERLVRGLLDDLGFRPWRSVSGKTR
jgi:hypothetical protein